MGSRCLARSHICLFVAFWMLVVACFVNSYAEAHPRIQEWGTNDLNRAEDVALYPEEIVRIEEYETDPFNYKEDEATSGGVGGALVIPEDGGDNMKRDRRVPLSLLMKRALSLFTHWRPGPGHAAKYVDSNNDVVSAVARDTTRPRGQPLRWG